MYILGISAFYHDSSAALLFDGKIIAAAQEERFSRKKGDMSFPNHAIKYCLREANIKLSDVDYVTYYEKPLNKFERLIETYLSYAPYGIKSFITAMPIWLKEKLFLKSLLRKELNGFSGKILFTEHHQAHAASAFFPSPYNKAAILCIDGVGEWTTTSVWIGEKNILTPVWELHFPHSLGLLYSAFTYYTGFKVNSGEYKVMGLAPYGNPKYVDLIFEKVVDLKEDGTFRLNMEYFNFAAGLTMTSKKFDDLFGGPPRKPESLLTQKEMDLACSVQKVTERIILRLANSIKKETNCEYLCLSGGVALNCVANGHVLRENIFKDIWIQPASGDAGSSLGAALSTWYEYLGNERISNNKDDFMNGAYLGPAFSNAEIKKYLDSIKAPYRVEDNANHLNKKLAEVLIDGKVIGWFDGRMEFGPRSLGSRSIIGDARNSDMQKMMNLKIKYRESFRPFAPVVLSEDVNNYFKIDRKSPYMLLVADVNDEIRIPMSEEQNKQFGIDKLNVVRSSIPAVTHVDYSARLQTVHKETNPRFYSLMEEFKKVTGCSVLVNTSFNVRGEPIICSPEDAYRCFMRTEIDYLVLGDIILEKKEQPICENTDLWKEEFRLD